VIQANGSFEFMLVSPAGLGFATESRDNGDSSAREEKQALPE